MQPIELNINIENLKAEPKLKALEQRISPLVTCTIDEDGNTSYDLIECAIPLEELIESHGQSQRQS